jgi:hypothetical protein
VLLAALVYHGQCHLSGCEGLLYVLGLTITSTIVVKPMKSVFCFFFMLVVDLRREWSLGGP